MENRRQTEDFFRASVRRKAKRVLAMILVVIMVNFAIGNGSIISANGNTYNISTGALTINSSNLSTYNNAVITGTSNSNMITIDGVTANLTFSDMNLNIESSTSTIAGWYSAIKLTNGATLNLTIKGNNTLTGGTAHAAINVPKGCSLVVTQDSIGTLTATAGSGSAGIGADFGGNTDANIQTVGSITINGGTVKAYGKGVGAGIGGTMMGKTGNIVINGGTVYAEGGGGTLSNNLFWAACGAGIGGGSDGFMENITITGGNVTAVGGHYHMSYSNFQDHPGAGIGCGSSTGITSDLKYTCGTISITGGAISAIGGNNNAVNAIGYGLSPNVDISGDNFIGSVTISDSASVNTNGGAIHPLSNTGSLNMYKLAMTIYDGRLAKTIEGATIKVNGKTYLSDIKVNENYVGSIYCSLICNAVLTGEQTVEISAGGYSWITTVNFTGNNFDYTTVIGSKLYPVYLWFYDAAIASDISGVSLSVKQNGNLLNSNAAEGMVQLVCDKTITKYKASVGKMTAYMPTESSELTATVPGVNGGNAITVSGKTIKASPDGTIIILWDTVTTTQLSSTLDLSYGNITFADNGGKLDITYAPQNGGTETTVTGQYYQNEYEIIQSNNSTVTTNKIIFQNTTDFVNVKMNGVNMKSTEKAIDLQNAKAKLSLSGTNTIDCGDGGGGGVYDDASYYIGIHAASGSELTIDGSGSLEVKNPSSYGVGIGGYYNYSSGVCEGAGMIRIQGGTLNVFGKKGAAIGSCYFYKGNDFGSIYITGGTVNASSNDTGFENGAAIGGSSSGNPANVYITGGKVTAKTEEYYGGAAIGSGSYGVSGGKVVISGGYIEATATKSANISAIGGGYTGVCPDITISGGTIKASGRVASIGKAGGGTGGSLKITGGTICTINNGEPTINLTPTNGGTIPVYYTTADVSGIYGKDAAVNNASITGFDYGFTDVKTDTNGILHLYLPASAAGMETKASFNDVNYSGIITSAGSNVLKKLPNLQLQGTVSGKVFDDTPISHSTVKGDLFAWDSDGALSFTYFTDNTGTKTINANSGAANEGAAPKNAGTYYLKATLAENGEYSGAETDYIPFTITQSATEFESGIKTSSGDTGTNTFNYGDTIKVEVTPKATGTAPAPTANKMALFVGEKQITDPFNATNDVYTMTYNTKAKDLVIGNNTINAKYVGNSNMADYSEDVIVTLNKKAITSAVVNTSDASASKVYDVTNSFTSVALTTLTGVESGDTVKATADGTVTDVNVGTGKAFTATSVTLDGVHKEYYSLDKAAVSGNVSITQATATGVNQELQAVKGLAKEYTFDLTKLLPALSDSKSFGDITYTVATVTGDDNVLAQNPTDTDIVYGKITLKVKNVADKGKTAAIQIKVASKNYKDFTADLTVKTIDKIPLTIEAQFTCGEYNGNPYAYTGTPTFKNDAEVMSGITYTAKYAGRDGTTYDESETAPTNVGKYNLILTVSGESANTYVGTTTIGFEITEKPPYIPPYIPPIPQPTTETREVPVVVDNGGTNTNAAQVTVTRTTDSDGKKTDTVKFDEDKAKETVRKALETKTDTATISVTDIPGNNADKVEVQVPQSSMTQLGNNNIGLDVKTEKAALELPKETVSGLKDKDAKIQISEVKDSSEVEETKGLILKLAAGSEVIAAPLKIETNFTGKTKITLPIAASKLPTSKEELEKFLSSLAVVVQHSDGENKVDKGTIVYDEKGNLIGISIWVDKFSDFTIIKLPDNYFDYKVALSQKGTDTFAAQTVGYSPVAAQSVTVSKTGKGDITNLKVALSGSSADSFTLGALETETLNSSTTSAAFTIKPKDGLAAGTYTASVTVTADNGVSESFDVSFTAFDYRVELSQKEIYTFAAQTAGYSPVAAQSVTVSKTGTGDITNLKVALSGSNAESFTLGALETETLNSSTTSAAFTIKPKDGLAAGTYTASVIVTADNGVSESFDVSFTVNAVSTPEYETREIHYKVMADKEWNIKFTKEADKSTITNENVYVLDSAGKKVDVKVSYDSDNVLRVAPVSFYKGGETYSLYINKNVTSKNKISLVKALKYNFAVADISLEGKKVNELKDVAKDKEWKIAFTDSIDKKSFKAEDVNLVDENGKTVEAAVSTLQDKYINVKSKSLYESGKTYYLIVNEVASDEGDKMKKAVWIKFTVK